MGQGEFEVLEEHRHVAVGFGVAHEGQFAAVGGGQAHVSSIGSVATFLNTTLNTSANGCCPAVCGVPRRAVKTRPAGAHQTEQRDASLNIS